MALNPNLGNLSSYFYSENLDHTTETGKFGANLNYFKRHDFPAEVVQFVVLHNTWSNVVADKYTLVLCAGGQMRNLEGDLLYQFTISDDSDGVDTDWQVFEAQVFGDYLWIATTRYLHRIALTSVFSESWGDLSTQYVNFQQRSPARPLLVHPTKGLFMYIGNRQYVAKMDSSYNVTNDALILPEPHSTVVTALGFMQDDVLVGAGSYSNWNEPQIDLVPRARIFRWDGGDSTTTFTTHLSDNAVAGFAELDGTTLVFTNHNLHIYTYDGYNVRNTSLLPEVATDVGLSNPLVQTTSVYDRPSILRQTIQNRDNTILFSVKDTGAVTGNGRTNGMLLGLSKNVEGRVVLQSLFKSSRDYGDQLALVKRYHPQTGIYNPEQTITAIVPNNSNQLILGGDEGLFKVHEGEFSQSSYGFLITNIVRTGELQSSFKNFVIGYSGGSTMQDNTHAVFLWYTTELTSSFELSMGSVDRWKEIVLLYDPVRNLYTSSEEIITNKIVFKIGVRKSMITYPVAVEYFSVDVE